MNWEPFLQLFGEPTSDAVMGRLHSGCAAVITRSTWGQFAKTGPGFTPDDVDNIVKVMTRFVLAPLDGLRDLSAPLSGDCYMIGPRFDAFDFAQLLSMEFCCGSLSLSADALATREMKDVHDQATVALLFRYKHCFLAEEFFDVEGIAKWVRLISAKRGEPVSVETLLALLEVLKTVCDPGPLSSATVIAGQKVTVTL